MKIDKFNLDDGTYIRFKKIGKGQPILLLHTFRNRLEYSDKLGELLKKNTLFIQLIFQDLVTHQLILKLFMIPIFLLIQL